MEPGERMPKLLRRHRLKLAAAQRRKESRISRRAGRQVDDLDRLLDALERILKALLAEDKSHAQG